MTFAQAGQNNDITALLDLRRSIVVTAPSQNTLRLVDASNGTVYAFNKTTQTWDLPLSVSLAATLNMGPADGAAAAAGIPLDIDTDITLTADTTLTAPLVRFTGGTINYGTHALTIPRAEGEFTPWVSGTGTLQILRADRLTLEAMGAVGDGSTS